MLEKINLKEQLTNELKNKWYYQQIAWGLKINKHSVVFDKDFKFELEEIDWNDDKLDVEIFVKLNGETVYEEETLKSYGDGKYEEKTTQILDDICCYIANRI